MRDGVIYINGEPLDEPYMTVESRWTTKNEATLWILVNPLA